MANGIKPPSNKLFNTIELISDTTQTAAVSTSSVKFNVLRGQTAVLRSTNLDGSGVIALYYDAPDGSVDNPATFDSGSEAGNQVTLSPTYPERPINKVGTYRAAVTTGANTQGIVFVQL